MQTVPPLPSIARSRRAAASLVLAVLAVAAAPAGCREAWPDAGAGAAAAAGGAAAQAGPASPSQDAPMISVRVFDDSGRLVGPIAQPKVVRSDEEWRARLSAEQYRILRSKGTEPSFCGTLLDNKQEGVYACVGCSLPLFASDSKFESGTGWPSFFRPIAPENVAETSDRGHGMVRTEILCARCDGHLGHVFEDGPRPTGLRYCLNSESLTFTGKSELASLADPTAEGGAPAAAAAAAASRSAADGEGAARATAVFAGGCFWCVEAVFEELEGVDAVVSGYAGGSEDTANYQDVCSGATGHAEAVQISYDPARIRYEDLLRVHFATHDPTTLDRQGADVGTQYRSAIFYADEREKQLAQAFLDDLRASGAFPSGIVTTLEPLEAFYPAEPYHQDYVCNNPTQGYVQGVAMPKVRKVREKFADKLKESSPLDR
jgi:peptide methionine sulfoxide reductase msrA/msrB